MVVALVFSTLGSLGHEIYVEKSYLHGLWISNLAIVFLSLPILQKHCWRWKSLPCLLRISSLWPVSYGICITSNSNIHLGFYFYFLYFWCSVKFHIPLSKIATMFDFSLWSTDEFFNNLRMGHGVHMGILWCFCSPLFKGPQEAIDGITIGSMLNIKLREQYGELGRWLLELDVDYNITCKQCALKRNQWRRM